MRPRACSRRLLLTPLRSTMPIAPSTGEADADRPAELFEDIVLRPLSCGGANV
jgi:hypothetical protein